MTERTRLAATPDESVVDDSLQPADTPHVLRCLGDPCRRRFSSMTCGSHPSKLEDAVVTFPADTAFAFIDRLAELDAAASLQRHRKNERHRR